MSCRKDVATALRASGKRVTSARLAVIEALRHSGAHMTPSEVIEAVREDVPHVDPSTVYRTLAEMAETRLVAETMLGYGESFYEWIGDRPHHHHLHCEGCGREVLLDTNLVSGLADALRARHGFELNDSHVVLRGQCGECAAAGPARPRRG
jgi:Fur family ferric uptake transcriptional regulator